MIRAALPLLLCCCVGCAARVEIANGAASIWEAADAIERGAAPAAPAAAIKLQSAAIIQAAGSTYAPAGVLP